MRDRNLFTRRTKGNKSQYIYEHNEQRRKKSTVMFITVYCYRLRTRTARYFARQSRGRQVFPTR